MYMQYTFFYDFQAEMRAKWNNIHPIIVRCRSAICRLISPYITQYQNGLKILQYRAIVMQAQDPKFRCNGLQSIARYWCDLHERDLGLTMA